VGSVGITGLGYVGLPLAAAFAEAGLSVVGIEKDPDKVAALEGGDSYVEDVPSARLAPLLSSAAGDGGLPGPGRGRGGPGLPAHPARRRRKPDTRRVNALLDWSPENTLEDILERVISYVREQRADATVARS
jgi:nucleoside-diphosphate-sugar epimerase